MISKTMRAILHTLSYGNIEVESSRRLVDIKKLDADVYKRQAKRHLMIWILKSRSFSSHLTPSTWQPLPQWHCSMQSEV